MVHSFVFVGMQALGVPTSAPTNVISFCTAAHMEGWARGVGGVLVSPLWEHPLDLLPLRGLPEGVMELCVLG